MDRADLVVTAFKWAFENDVHDLMVTFDKDVARVTASKPVAPLPMSAGETDS